MYFRPYGHFEEVPSHQQEGWKVWRAAHEMRERLLHLSDEALDAAGITREQAEHVARMPWHLTQAHHWFPNAVIEAHSRGLEIGYTSALAAAPYDTVLKVFGHELGHAFFRYESHLVIQRIPIPEQACETQAGWSKRLERFISGCDPAIRRLEAMAVAAIAYPLHMAFSPVMKPIRTMALGVESRIEEHYADRMSDILVPEVNREETIYRYRTIPHHRVESPVMEALNTAFKAVRYLWQGASHPLDETRNALSSARLGRIKSHGIEHHALLLGAALLETAANQLAKLPDEDCRQTAERMREEAREWRRHSALPLSHWGMRIATERQPEEPGRTR